MFSDTMSLCISTWESKTPISFSNIPTGVLLGQIGVVLDELDDYGAHELSKKICHDTLLLLGSIRSELQGNYPDVVVRLRSGVKQLNSIIQD